MGVMVKVALEAELKLVMMKVDKEMNSEAVEAFILKLMQHRNFSKKILTVGSIGSKCWRAAILESSPTYQMTREPRTTMRKVSLGIFHSPKKSWKCGL